MKLNFDPILWESTLVFERDLKEDEDLAGQVLGEVVLKSGSGHPLPPVETVDRQGLDNVWWSREIKPWNISQKEQRFSPK